MHENEIQIFPAYRLVAEYADGQRLTFDGFTWKQAYEAMEAAQDEHGDIGWYDGVTDRFYENGRFYATVPSFPHSLLSMIEPPDDMDFEQQRLF